MIWYDLHLEEAEKGKRKISKIHLFATDFHAHPEHNNDRADWLGRLLLDVKPDVFINGGDQWDFPSLSGYDKGKASFYGKAYKRDLDCGLEFSERLFAPMKKAKKKKPRCVFLEGNHCERQRRLLEYSPELEGTIGFEDLGLDQYYDDIIRYKGSNPGVIDIDGILYGHFFVSGVAGRNIGGEHAAYSLITKNFQSSSCGHSHTFDYSVRTDGSGKRINGLVAGCYLDFDLEWAGQINALWSRGVVIKREVSQGDYDLQWISLESLKKEYG